MKRYIYVLFICLLWNCGGQQNFNNTFEEIIDCQDFLADIVDYRTEDLIIDDIIDTIIIVKLETKEESLLGSIKDIAISDDNIYILDDYNSIVIFDKSGTYVNHLTKGGGPGELKYPSCIVFSKDLNAFYVIQYLSVNKYNANGEFIETYEIQYHCNNVVPYGKDFCVFQNYTGNYSRKSFVILCDSMFVPKRHSMLPVDDKLLLSEYPLSVCSDGGALLAHPFDTNIYWYSDDSLKIKYKLNFAKYQYEVDENAGIEQIFQKQHNKFYFPGIFYETSNYQLFKLNVGQSKSYSFYRNKSTNKTRYGCIYKPTENCAGLPAYFSVPFGVYNGYFVGFMDKERYELNDYLLTNFKAGRCISEEDVEKIKSHRDDDNHLIIFYKLKDIK